MNPEPWNWTKEDLEQLIGQTESLRLDFKESRLLDQPREQVVNNLSREVSAFANTEGGTIVLGIIESGEDGPRVADRLDDGVDVGTWRPERLQQIVESNISPHLTGLRIKPIPRDESKTRYYFVIFVAPGTTAYQASDRRYYGRSEYESKALPDHEVRLRMFRGRAANAIVQAQLRGHEIIELTDPKDEKVTRKLGWYAEAHKEEINQATVEMPLCIERYLFDLTIQNIGEMNITEFKVVLRFSPPDFVHQAEDSWAFRDGWPDPRHRFWIPSGMGGPGNEPRPMTLNIYPQDVFNLSSVLLFFRSPQNLTESHVVLDWTLFLSNTVPIYGRINLASEFKGKGENWPSARN